jgi:hypothetical protein
MEEILFLVMVSATAQAYSLIHGSEVTKGKTNKDREKWT